LKYRHDSDTCALSSFASAVEYVALKSTTRKAKRLFCSLAKKADATAVQVGGGSFAFEGEIRSMFGQYRNKLWVKPREKFSTCILEFGKPSKSKEENIIYTYCLLTTDGANDHVVSICDCLIFDNNFPYDIPMNFDNLSLCGGLGDLSVKYKCCSSIFQWKFGVNTGNYKKGKRNK